MAASFKLAVASSSRFFAVGLFLTVATAGPVAAWWRARGAVDPLAVAVVFLPPMVALAAGTVLSAFWRGLGSDEPVSLLQAVSIQVVWICLTIAVELVLSGLLPPIVRLGDIPRFDLIWLNVKFLGVAAMWQFLLLAAALNMSQGRRDPQ